MSNEIMDSPITQEELDVMMASLAVGFMVSTIDNSQPIREVCATLDIDVHQYMDMLFKAAQQGVQGDTPTKMEDVVRKIIAETYPAVLKLSNSIN